MSEQYAKITPLGSKWFVPAAEFQLVRNAQRHNNSGINGRIDAAINTAVRSRPAGRIYWAAGALPSRSNLQAVAIGHRHEIVVGK